MHFYRIQLLLRPLWRVYTLQKGYTRGFLLIKSNLKRNSSRDAERFIPS
jgi:hypothetical protein